MMAGTRRAAYSYVRMSTDVQLLGDSLRRQLEATRRYCEEQNLELVEEMSDIGKSAFQGQHISDGVFGMFLEKIRVGEIIQGSVLVVESLDRLSRQSVMQAFGYFSLILQQKVDIVTLIDNQTYTYDTVSNDPGKLFLSLGVMLRAHEESKTKSNRLKAVWQKKRDSIAQSKLTRLTPAWIDLTKGGKDFKVNPQAAQTINLIYDMCIDGIGYTTIARRLNEREIPTIGKSSIWNISYIKKILSSRQLIGEFQPHIKSDGKRQPVGDPIKDYYPAVLSEGKFRSAQKSIASRRQKAGGRKGITYANLFQHLVKCGSCGCPMYIINKGKPTKGAKYFYCKTALHGGGCKNGYWRYDAFETNFLQFVSGLNLHEVFDEKDRAKMNELEIAIDTMEDKLEALDAKIEQNSDAWAGAEPRLQMVLQSSMNQQLVEREKLGGELSLLKEKLAATHWQEPSSAKSSLEVLNEKLTYNLSEEERFRIRNQLANHLTKIVEKVVLQEGLKINPWEIDEVDSDSSIVTERLLKTLGEDPKSELELLANSENGRLKLQKLDRTYVVVFKSGRRANVHHETGALFESQTPQKNSTDGTSAPSR